MARYHLFRRNRGVQYALYAAALFGASTPLAKLLSGNVPPLMLAGLLYGGSGLGLSLWMLARKRGDANATDARLTGHDAPWLAGAIAAGGIAGPIFLMFGITMIPGSSASLLLNLEGVFTALIAWFVFQENFDRRIFLGMALIVAAGVLLSTQERQAGIPLGGMLVGAACLCWAIDNNLTRKVSASDPLQIAALKGGVAGIVNTTLALSMGNAFPAIRIALGAATIGLAGYGISLVLFVLALRYLGTARTGAYFSAAPFIGAAVSLLLLHETPMLFFWIATALMGAGIWLHLTERHEHAHAHEEMTHEHSHVHDEHHRHDHESAWDGTEPHTHSHRHEAMTHKHPHYPDIHHRHSH